MDALDSFCQPKVMAATTSNGKVTEPAPSELCLMKGGFTMVPVSSTVCSPDWRQTVRIYGSCADDTPRRATGGKTRRVEQQDLLEDLLMCWPVIGYLTWKVPTISPLVVRLGTF